MLDAKQVAALLDEIGMRLELTGESPFKVRAYHTGAEALRELATPLADAIAGRGLMKLPGIGEALAEKIIALHKRGTHRTLERLREEVPDGLVRMRQIPGLGPKKVLQLRDDLGIEDLPALEEAARAGKLAGLKGFGAKLEQKVQEALAFAKTASGRYRMDDAEALLAQAQKGLEAFRDEPAGEARRACETVGELSLVAVPEKGAELPGRSGEARIVSCEIERFGAVLLFATGSPAFVEALAARARSKGYALSAAGFEKGGKRVFTPEERDVFEALGLPFIAPELRESGEVIARAEAGKLPKLIELADIRGILHSHTNYSDGMNSLEEMCEAVRERGWSYYGVCDHSQSAGYAGGMKLDKIEKQHAEIERLHAKYAKRETAFRVFKGIESDILEDGRLDYPEEVLKRFDFVVASVHSRFELDEKAQTERIVNAVRNPFTTILGHATGRLLLRREGYRVDLEAVLRACAELGVAVEINAHPARLDVDWRWHARAKEWGCRFSINPDAHSVGELALTKFGVAVARKGGLEAKDNLTSLSAEELAAYFAERRKVRSS